MTSSGLGPELLLSRVLQGTGQDRMILPQNAGHAKVGNPIVGCAVSDFKIMDFPPKVHSSPSVSHQVNQSPSKQRQRSWFT